MKTLSQFIEEQKEHHHTNEEYLSGVAGRTGNSYHEIFRNPDASEIRDLKKESVFVRFIAMKNDLFVFPASLLHAEAIHHLKLSISSTPPVRVAFLGVAKINGPTSLELHETNQQMSATDAAKVETFHPILRKYFPDSEKTG